MKTAAWSFLVNVETGKIEEGAYESVDHSDDFSSQSPSLLEGDMANIVDPEFSLSHKLRGLWPRSKANSND